jgi:putative ABC transport system permease protein
VDLGIDPTNVVTMGLRLPDYKYSSRTQHALFYRELLQRVGSVPGVKSAGAEGGGSNVFFQPQGQPPAAPGQEPTASYKIITPDFLKAMGIGLKAAASSRVATPNVQRRLPLLAKPWHASPVGSQLTLLAHVYTGRSSDAAQPLEIVGVVKDVRNHDLWKPEAAVYVPFQQHPVPSVFLVVRTAVPPMSVVPAVRGAVLALDKNQPVNEIRTMDEIVSQTYGAIRFPMTLLWIFAALALVLSAVGIFGVMSYTVSRRTQEMAIRMALGASRREVLRLVLRDGLRLTAVGVMLGLVAAGALSRVMAGYIYGITSTDPLTLVGASLVLTVVALLACYLPARRATRVNPIAALRYE